MFSLLLTLTALAGFGGGFSVDTDSSAADPHPNSISRLEIRFSEDELALTWQIQMRTIMEVPQLKWDGHDLWAATPDEARQYWPQIQTYLQDGFEIQVDGKSWSPAFEDYELRLEGAGFYVECVHPLSAKPKALALGIEHFFDDGNPEHIMDVEIHGLSPKVDRYFIQYRRRAISFPLPLDPEELAAANQAPVVRYLSLGWSHVLEGYDHLAFVLALLLGVASWRALLAAVTSFTLAHSITLALSALDILKLSPAIVEPGIAISVAVVLWWHLWRGPGKSKAWKPAFGFGLLHGCGFAGVLGEIGIPEDAMLSALFGFNLGVEVGQLTFVIPVILGALFLKKALGPFGAQKGLQLAALLLAAFAFHLVGVAATNYIGFEWPLLADALQTVPSILIMALLLALALRGRRSPQGTPMMPQLGNALLLAVLYQIGHWAGGI